MLADMNALIERSQLGDDIDAIHLKAKACIISGSIQFEYGNCSEAEDFYKKAFDFLTMEYSFRGNHQIQALKHKKDTKNLECVKHMLLVLELLANLHTLGSKPDLHKTFNTLSLAVFISESHFEDY